MNDEAFTWTARSVGSLTGYYLARQQRKKTWYPYVILGGMAGSLLARIILEATAPPKHFPPNTSKP